MKVIKWLDEHAEECVMVILLVVITCISFLQVVIRKIPWIPALTWAEEFCRFCWIWSVFLSVPYTLKKSSMLRVTVLLDIIPEKIMKVLNIAVYVVTTLSLSVLAFYSVGVVKDIRESGELSPAMRFPMWVVYSMMLIGFSLSVFRGLQQIYHHVKHINEHELTTTEQAMLEAKKDVDQMEGGEE